MTFRSIGLGTSVELVAYVLYNVYAHINLMKYLLTHLHRIYTVWMGAKLITVQKCLKLQKLTGDDIRVNVHTQLSVLNV